MRPLLCCSVRRQGSWKCGNCVLTAGYRPIIHQEGSDSNANKCHNPVFNYIPSKNVTVAGNDKKNLHQLIHIPQKLQQQLQLIFNHPKLLIPNFDGYLARQEKRVPIRLSRGCFARLRAGRDLLAKRLLCMFPSTLAQNTQV